MNGHPFALRSFRLPYPDADNWREAAVELKISRSEFIRRALREKAIAAFQQRWAQQIREPHNKNRFKTKKPRLGQAGKTKPRSEAKAKEIQNRNNMKMRNRELGVKLSNKQVQAGT
jgi:hypothetical protein